MNTEEIGYISKTHGLKGHLILRLNELINIDEEAIKSVFLELNGSQVPYFIEECRPNNTGYILKLETIDSIDTSKKLIGKKAFALTDFILENSDSLNEFIGYSVIDSRLGNIGIITDIDEKTDNPIVKVIHSTGVEIILPFNDDFIIEIDDDQKTIQFESPEGLIEMYLHP
ncbi:MAG: rimM [Bacteroidetes bacterium]|jgi:16S rRNA processing protein RimM|nr:rimM [Bacteroidota bacterium]MDF2453253.1 rimM [Bacteroidota bacterium]